jgi:hypothetical protein
VTPQCGRGRGHARGRALDLGAAFSLYEAAPRTAAQAAVPWGARCRRAAAEAKHNAAARLEPSADDDMAQLKRTKGRGARGSCRPGCWSSGSWCAAGNSGVGVDGTPKQLRMGVIILQGDSSNMVFFAAIPARWPTYPRYLWPHPQLLPYLQQQPRLERKQQQQFCAHLS